LIALTQLGIIAWLSAAPPEATPPTSDPPRSTAYVDVLEPLPEDQRDEATAKRLMESGKMAFRADRFEDAIELFAEAYRLHPHVTLLYSLGSAHRRAYEMDGNVEHRRLSIRRYQQYLSEAPDGESSSLAQNYLTALLAERDLGSIEQEVQTRILVSTRVEEAMMSVDGATPVPAPGVISVQPGPHELHVTAPGYAEFVQRVDVPEGATYQIDAALIGLDGSVLIEGPKRAWVQLDGNVVGRLPLTAPLQTAPGPHVLVVSKAGHEPFSADIEVEREGWQSVRASLDRSNQRIASSFLFGLGGAGLIAGAAQLGYALDREAKAAELQRRRTEMQLSTADYQRYLDLVDERNAMRTGAIIAGIGGGVLLLTGVVLFVYDNPRPSSGGEVARRWAPTVGPGQAGAMLRF
jgi:tetratricopeptide (TPR) repeat protein